MVVPNPSLPDRHTPVAVCAWLLFALLAPSEGHAAPTGGQAAPAPESPPRASEPATGPAPAAGPARDPARAATPSPQAPSRKGAAPAAPPRGKSAAGAAAPDRASPPARRPELDRPRPSTDAERPRPTTDGDKEPEEKPMRRLQGSAWSLVGVTAVLLTVTGVFALLVEDREDELERMATFLDPYNGGRPLPYSGLTRRDFESYQKEGKRFEAAAFTFLGLSAAAAVGAAALFIADHLTKDKERPARALQVQPLMSPRGAGLAVGLEF